MKKILSSLLLFSLFVANIQVVQAIPARRGGEHYTQIETCEPAVKRFPYGPGRRSSSTAVLVTIRQQVFNVGSQLDAASSAQTITGVRSDDQLGVRLSIRNASIYDVGDVEIKHAFKSSQPGLLLEGVASVDGAFYDERRSKFTVDRIESGETAEVTFRLLLNDDVDINMSQNKFEVVDFVVLESERRYPPSSPDTVPGRTTQDVVKLGIGGTAVSCFKAYEEYTVIPPSTVSTGGSRDWTSDSTRDWNNERQSGVIQLSKRASRQEAKPGEIVSYTVTVQNRGDEIVKNAIVDDRFDTSKQNVENAGGGLVTGFGIRWVISSLSPGEKWTTRYSTKINSSASQGDVLPNTVTVTSDDLSRADTAKLRSNSQIRVVNTYVIPQTGV
ncbi:DUF11 domain-containing protein, partial [Candidatus Peribacteria bacterium]|nr:DUF11 domain-containing protein [Candidatus Peribacteria bacterium]